MIGTSGIYTPFYYVPWF